MTNDGLPLATVPDVSGGADDELPALVRDRPTWLLSQAAARSHRLLTEGLAAAGFRGYEVRLLAAAAEFGPASQASLSRHSGVDRSDVVATVNALERRGLVARAADPADGRRNVISITPAGTRALRSLDSVLADIQDVVLAPLSPRQRRQFVAMLSRLVDRSA
jgi:DNA-binding MarR family transcriptional regulator